MNCLPYVARFTAVAIWLGTFKTTVLLNKVILVGKDLGLGQTCIKFQSNWSTDGRDDATFEGKKPQT